MSNASAITIDNVYPWGRSFSEYRNMFALTDDDLNSRILGCADGPASFNAELTSRGGNIVSCDPLYQYSADEIRSRIGSTYDSILSIARNNYDRFLWNSIKSPEQLGQLRMAAMNDFLDDYDDGKRTGRYLRHSLPHLQFVAGRFDLAVCSHFLFLYSDDFSIHYHFNSILEMCRLAREVRIFPLLDMQGRISAHLVPLLPRLAALNLVADLVKVEYEFQRGGNQMLRVRRQSGTH
jgi:hypothetical protein